MLFNIVMPIFRHLKLELITQFPASNDTNYLYLWKVDISNIELLLLTTKNNFIKFRDISIDLKPAWNRIYTGLAGQGLTPVLLGPTLIYVIAS